MAKEMKIEDIQNNLKDEIDLLELLQILIKRKTIIIALFMITTILGVVYTLLIPRVYRGEFTIVIKLKKTFTENYQEIESPIINPNDIIFIFSLLKNKKLEKILSKDYQMIKDIKLEIVGSSNNKLKLIIESTDKNKISNFGQLLVDYLSQNSTIREIVNTRKEQLQMKLEEVNKIIKSYDEISNIMKRQLREDRVSMLGFNPLELERDLIALKIEKSILDKEIQDEKELEIIDEFIYEDPIKPKTKLIIVISMIIGLIVGVILALFLESYQKFFTIQKE